MCQATFLGRKVIAEPLLLRNTQSPGSTAIEQTVGSVMGSARLPGGAEKTSVKMGGK